VFAAGELRIDSWELRCLDCGLRKTVAFRSDEPREPQVETRACPFCALRPESPGKDPCRG
jgi:hypothetical protein